MYARFRDYLMSDNKEVYVAKILVTRVDFSEIKQALIKLLSTRTSRSIATIHKRHFREIEVFAAISQRSSKCPYYQMHRVIQIFPFLFLLIVAGKGLFNKVCLLIEKADKISGLY
jgi:hypothetical protein